MRIRKKRCKRNGISVEKKKKKLEEDRTRWKKRKARDRFWSIFQGEEKASKLSFENVM